jgi:hypothetical protein
LFGVGGVLGQFYLWNIGKNFCLVLDKWVVPSRKETDPKSEKQLNNVSKPKSGLIDYHQVVLTKKSKSDTFIELVIPVS